MSSDSCYSLRLRCRANLSVIDDEWLLDSLSDDEIEVANEVSRNAMNEDDDDLDDEEGDAVFRRINEEDCWEDLGLDIFLRER